MDTAALNERTLARRSAPVQRPVLDEIAERWSPRAFDPDEPVETAELLNVLEAARWAPSSRNSQPWRYVVFDEAAADAREEARSLLKPGNAWARHAPVLILTVALTAGPDSDEANPAALYDLGASSLALLLQATAEGLVAHPVGGFDKDGARRLAALPAHAEPVTMIALGRPGRLSELPEALLEREQQPRQRRPVAEIAFRGGLHGPSVAAEQETDRAPSNE